MTTPNLNISESDKEFALRVLVHQKSKAVVDWKAFAPKAGLASANSASSRWSKVERKLTEKYGSLRDSSVASSVGQNSTTSNTSTNKTATTTIKHESTSPSSSTTSVPALASRSASPPRITAGKATTGRVSKTSAATERRKRIGKTISSGGIVKSRVLAQTTQAVVHRQQNQQVSQMQQQQSQPHSRFHTGHTQTYAEVAVHSQTHSLPSSRLPSPGRFHSHSPVHPHSHPHPQHMVPSQQRQLSNQQLNRNVVDPRMIEIVNSCGASMVDVMSDRRYSSMDMDMKGIGLGDVLEIDMDDGEADAYGEIDIDV